LTGSNPTDRGKRGTKRHVLTDKKGIPLSVVITAANTHDIKAATDTLDSVIVERPLKKQNLCLDKGYDFPEIERESTKRRYIPHIFFTEVKKKN
jgi:putative transposase